MRRNRATGSGFFGYLFLGRPQNLWVDMIVFAGPQRQALHLDGSRAVKGNPSKGGG